MYEDDSDIDIESDNENDSDTRSENRSSNNGTPSLSQAEKRAHHNALERKRRDHIKDSFTSLKDSVPALRGEKAASRAQILREAADFIQLMGGQHYLHQEKVSDLKRQNKMLEHQIKLLEQQESNTRDGEFHKDMTSSDIPSDQDEVTDEEEVFDPKIKRFKSLNV